MPALLRSAAILTAAALLLSGCVRQDPELEQPFQSTTEPSPVPMPEARAEDLPQTGGGAVTQTPESASDPCATNEVVVAACLEETTALVAVAPRRAVVAAGTALWEVGPGMEPRQVADLGARVRQLLVGAQIEEDGQVWALLADGRITRLTLLPGGGADVREMGGGPDVELILLGPSGQLESVRSLSDEYLDLVGACQDPVEGTVLLTVVEQETPMLAVWDGVGIEFLGSVDRSATIAGCSVTGADALVAVPDAGRVMHQGLEESASYGGLAPSGPPTIAVDGTFGRISAVTVSESDGEELLWVSTANKGHEPGESDDRVIIVPGGSASGAAPD